MSIDSARDWEGLREAGRVTRLTLDALERHARVGVSTAELDGVAADVFREHGARSAPAIVYGFPRTVLISINDEIVHGVPGRRRLRRGDLVKIDVTVEKDGYVADAARSLVIEGGSDTAHRLAACAAAALDAALEVARAGLRVNGIGRAVDREVRRQGFAVVKGLTGHGVGRTIHEWPTVANRYMPWQTDVLTEGLVLTIEPMISAGSSQSVQDANGWTIRTSDGSLAAHHEHTLVITREQPVILTAA
ncbi:MAG TPA: type I methionyl aminopeptidase [Vicinamibacterales bacterium]|jgi:methionyl aminopeptidase